MARPSLSPLNQRRWANFSANKRGFYALWLFLAVFGLTLIAEVIANDRPIFVAYKGEFLLPVLVDYPEEKFGGFLARTDYRDPMIEAEIAAHGWAIWPMIRYGHQSVRTDGGPFPAPPTWSKPTPDCTTNAARSPLDCTMGHWNWLGTDDQGRDVLARLIYGFRISVLFGLILTLFSSLVGIFAGAVQGYFGGWLDLLFQRFIEIWASLPTLYLIIIIAAVIEPTFWILLGILLLFNWVSLVGVVRAEFLRARNFEYVQAARALGVRDRVIMVRHVLPNAMVATLTFMPFLLNGSLTELTALDFLGLGLPPGSPSLGEMLAQGKNNPTAPWLGLSGFFVTAAMLSMLIFIGEAVRDGFDPRKTFTQG